MKRSQKTTPSPEQIMTMLKSKERVKIVLKLPEDVDAIGAILAATTGIPRQEIYTDLLIRAITQTYDRLVERQKEKDET